VKLPDDFVVTPLQYVFVEIPKRLRTTGRGSPVLRQVADDVLIHESEFGLNDRLYDRRQEGVR